MAFILFTNHAVSDDSNYIFAYRRIQMKRRRQMIITSGMASNAKYGILGRSFISFGLSVEGN